MVLPVSLQTADLVLRAGTYSGVGDWIDESPNGFNAQLIGDVGWNGRRFSLAAGGYIQILDDPALNWAAATAGYVVIICRATNPSATPMTLVKKRTGQGGSGGTGWEIYRTQAGDFEFEMLDDAAATSFRTVPDIDGASFISISRSTFGGHTMRRNRPFNEDDEANSSTAAGDPSNTEPFIIGNLANEGELEVWGVAFWNDEVPVGDIFSDLVEHDPAGGEFSFDPEVHHHDVIALRTSAYQGVKDTIDESAIVDDTTLGHDAKAPSVELAKEMWDPSDQAMKLRTTDHYWDITPAVFSTSDHSGSAIITSSLLYHMMVVGRLIDGTENSKMAILRVADPGSELAHIALGVDAAQPWLRIDDGAGNVLDEVLPQTIPLNTKFAIGFTRNGNGNVTDFFWINRDEVHQISPDPLAAGGAMNWTELNVKFRIGKAPTGGGLIPGDRFVGDFFGFVYGWGAAIDQEHFFEESTWVDAGSFEPNIQVTAALRESAWAMGGLRS